MNNTVNKTVNNTAMNPIYWIIYSFLISHLLPQNDLVSLSLYVLLSVSPSLCPSARVTHLVVTFSMSFCPCHTDKNPPVDLVVEAGVVPRLVQVLSRNDSPKLQLEAAWAITNIACAGLQHATLLINHGKHHLYYITYLYLYIVT